MLTKNSQGSLSLEGHSIAQLAEEYGTPLYLYSQRQIEDNIKNLQKALSPHFTRYRIQYAIKANSNPHLVKIIKEMGLSADCSSPTEALLAQSLGFPMDTSTYTGVFESREDFTIPLKNQMIINLDDDEKLDDLLSLKKGTPSVLSFRINPGIGRGQFDEIVTGGSEAKFGIPHEKTSRAYKKALSKGFKRFGIHMMTGSNILDPSYFSEITEKLLSIVETHVSPLKIPLEFINIGGGLGIPYHPEEKPLDTEKTFSSLAKFFHQKVQALNIGNPVFTIEPGRWLVGNGGWLVSRITHIKESYRNFVGLDSGMNTLLRPALYKAYHQIHLDGEPEAATGKSSPYRVCGQVCESSDVHPKERFFCQPKSGGLAVITNAGAYGFTMSNHYNNRPRAAEVLITPKGSTLIRTRESHQDIFQRVPNFTLSNCRT